MSATYTLTGDAVERLQFLVAGVENREALNADLGRRLARDLRDYFGQRNVEGPRNKLGAPSSGFWGEIRDSVLDSKADAEGALVVISDVRFVQKFFGGDIHKDDHMLAIPARAEAYGHSPRDFSNLKAIFFEHGAALIAMAPRVSRIKGEKRIGQVREAGLIFFWLVDVVHQVKDEEALPPEGDLMAGLLDTAGKHVKRLTEGGR